MNVERITQGMERGLPQELWDMIFLKAIEDSHLTRVVILFVCSEWKDNIRRLAPNSPFVRGTSLSAEAATGGHLNLLKWMRGMGCPWDSYTGAQAAYCGHLEMLKWAMANGCKTTLRNILVQASSGGRVEVLEWVFPQVDLTRGRKNTFPITMAASEGHVEALNWLHGKGIHGDAKSCAEAAMNGHLEALKWLREVDKCPWDKATTTAAAEYGHLHVLRWCVAEGCPMEGNAYKVAADRGHVDVLTFLKEEAGLPWDPSLCGYNYPIRTGQFGVVQWMRANGCPWGTAECADAALYDQLEILQWLRANGCPWDSHTCVQAVRKPEVLTWAIENGCPCNSEAVEWAVRCSAWDSLKYMIGKGVAWHPATLSGITSNGTVDIVAWAMENGCPWTKTAYYEAAKANKTDIIDWLHDNGYPVDASVCTGAAEYGHLATLQKLIGQGYPITIDAALQAAHLSRLEVLKWLKANGYPWDNDSIYAHAQPWSTQVVEWMQKELGYVAPNKKKK